MNFVRLIIFSGICIFCGFSSNSLNIKEFMKLDAQRLHKQKTREQTKIEIGKDKNQSEKNSTEAVENFVKQIIQEFAPEPLSTKFHEINAPYLSLLQAYVVNCIFSTKDVYGKYQKYNIQVKVKINSDNNGELYFEDFDWSELQ